MTSRRPSPFVYAGVFIVSGVALGLEILLTRVMALMMWHHLTYVVIGVALLGFGAAGSYVTVREARSMEPDPLWARRLARYTLCLAISIPVCYVAMTRVHIEPQALMPLARGLFKPWEMGDALRESGPGDPVALLFLCGLIATPFFFAGLVICDAILTFRERVGSIYFVDLLGAGVGAAAAVTMIESLTGPGALLVFGAIAAFGSVAFTAARSTFAPGIAVQGLVGLALGVFLLWFGVPIAKSGKIDPPLAPMKELQRAASVVGPWDATWTPLARIEVQSEPRPNPPITGGTFPVGTPNQEMRYIFQDGTAPTGIMGWDGSPESLEFLGTGSIAAGHVALGARGVEGVEEMVIGVGGGIDLLVGVHFGAAQITGVEINGATVRLLTDRYADFSGGLAARPEVELVRSEGRSYARTAGRQFDLIQLSGVDTFTALNSGAYTLSESYVYTQEAVREFLGALTDDGVICYSRFLFQDGPRETLRLAGTALEALEAEGIASANQHLFVLGANSWASLLISKRPFEPAVLDALVEFGRANGFLVLFDPRQEIDNPFHDLLRTVAGDAREAFYDGYDFQVRPSTDDSPFFFNFFKWKSLWEQEYEPGHPYHVEYPMGHASLVWSLFLTVVLGATLILLPLRRLKGVVMSGGTIPALLYFSALGVGFIAIEIVLIQRLVLYLGHPTYSLTTVLPTVLVSAGIGSLTVGPSTDAHKRLRLLALLVPLVVVVEWWLSGFVLDRLLGLALWVRIAAAVALLAPLGLVLGQAFPVGIALVSERRPELVPWAWAVNSFTTVLGSTATVLLAMEVGFSVVMLGAAPLYLVGIGALGLSFRKGAAPAPAELP